VLASCRLADALHLRHGVQRIEEVRRMHAEGARHSVPFDGRETAASFRRRPRFTINAPRPHVAMTALKSTRFHSHSETST
jgi:hypothetical protein